MRERVPQLNARSKHLHLFWGEKSLALGAIDVSRVDQQPAIFIGDTTLVVVGILDDTQREPVLLDAIIIPNGTARHLFNLGAPAEVQIRTELGAAQLIGQQAAIALSPNDPSLLRVTVPPEPKAVKEQVESDVNTLFLVLGAVALLVGAIGIANVTLVSVLERVGEIGLRRAVGATLGATRRHIAAEFLAESAAMGLVGGLIGASIGVLIIVAVSATRQWTPVLDPWVPLAAPLVGAATGLIAGLYPSWRAASLEPIDALRTGM